MPGRSPETPRLGKQLLYRMLEKSSRYDILGDFEEEYKTRLESYGRGNALVWYWGQVSRSIPAFFYNYAAWNLVMLKNYLKTSIRNLKSNRGYSILNIAGLILGMACSLELLLWVIHDLNFDSFHDKSDRIYRLVAEIKGDRLYDKTARVPSNLGSVLTELYPEVIEYSSYIDRDRFVPVAYGSEVFTGYKVFYSDSTFLSLFSFPLFIGDSDNALSGNDPVILTERMSKEIFGDINSIGKILKIDRRECTVTGIMKDIPTNSHLQFDCVTRFRSFPKDSGFNNFVSTVYGTYVLLDEKCNPGNLEKAISNDSLLYARVNIPETSLFHFDMNGITLQPLEDIYLNSQDLRGDRAVTGEIREIYILISLSLITMMVTCMNFINITSLRSQIRLKEAGMRKLTGARRKHLFRQFFCESIMVFFTAAFFAVVIVYSTLPILNEAVSRKLTLALLWKENNILVLFGVLFFTAYITGYYPAVFMSSAKPLLLLKNEICSSLKRGQFIRRALIVIQLSTSTILIMSSVIIFDQMNFVNKKDLGFDKNDILIVGVISDHVNNMKPLIKKLYESPDIMNVTVGPRPIYHQIGSTSEVSVEGRTVKLEQDIQCYNIDHNYIDTYRMELVSGINFNIETKIDPSEYILNEEAVNILGLRSPVGKKISINGIAGSIIGIIKNFHHSSLHDKIQPVVLRKGDSKAVNIRHKPGRRTEAVEYIKAVFTEKVQDYPYNHIYLEDTLNEFYTGETRIGKVLSTVSLITIIIACLGFYSQASFSSERRTKELGIRKVFGASLFSIVRLLAFEIAILIIIANAIAIPFSWYLISFWLQNFAYRTEIEPVLFFLTSLTVTFTALSFVGSQVLKAAKSFPVKCLKCE